MPFFAVNFSKEKGSSLGAHTTISSRPYSLGEARSLLTAGVSIIEAEDRQIAEEICICRHCKQIEDQFGFDPNRRK